MEEPEVVRRQYMLAVLQNEADQNKLAIYRYIQGRHRWRRGQRRRWWTRPWIRRRRQFGLYMYDQLMVELRREDEAAFINFMRMTPEMFDELLDRISEMIEMLRSVDILYQLSRYRKMAARRAHRTAHGRRTGGGRS